MELVTLEWDGGIAVLTINRPKALNALNAQAIRELQEAIGLVAANPNARALIVTGGGEKAFVAGADIAEMAGYTTEQALAFATEGHKLGEGMAALGVPTIAAVNGFALGGGCELAMACDFIYASEKAKFGLPEVTLAVIPGFGGTQRLTRLVGRARAKELVFTGDMIDAAKAKEVGLVLDVLPPEKLLAHCKEVAGKIAKRGPVAIAQAKRVIDQGADVSLADGCALERQAFAMLFATADQKEGMKAFLEKRPANFTGK
jgi:enoyl-CoA hydratase